MYFKNAKIPKFYQLISIILLFTTFSCSSLDIVPNKSYRFKDVQEAKGNAAVESTPLTERFKKIFEESTELNFNKSVTYEVALKQFSIMPLVSVDRSSGVIITDWYSTTSNKSERVKFNIFILDENMQDESINIVMFKEIFNGSSWISTKVNGNTSAEIKDLIIKKAKQLKAAAELS